METMNGTGAGMESGSAKMMAGKIGAEPLVSFGSQCQCVGADLSWTVSLSLYS